MLPEWSLIAFKEWAVTVAALERGDQVVLLRKGGIREDGKHFRIEHNDFFLYPTYEHQVTELVKPEFHGLFNETLLDADDALVTLNSYAEIAETFETSDEEAVANLLPLHIWTATYAEKRIHWKPRFPLTVMVLRVHKLQQPQALPVMPEYDGCKSWVTLVEEYPVGVATPVLNDRQFNREVAKIRDALGVVAA